MAITTKEAVVQTVSVNVKALRIGTKQMTMAVFRQLPKKRLLKRDATLNGIPWGKVNYFWGDCSPNHLHIVWQEERNLYRDCIYNPANNIPKIICDYSESKDKASSSLLMGAYLIVIMKTLSLPEYHPPLNSDNNMTTELRVEWIKESWYTTVNIRKGSMKIKEYLVLISKLHDIWSYRNEFDVSRRHGIWNEVPLETPERRRQRIEQTYNIAIDYLENEKNKYAQSLNIEPDLLCGGIESVRSFLRQEYLLNGYIFFHEQIQELQKEFSNQYEKLCSLDQLFIAV